MCELAYVGCGERVGKGRHGGGGRERESGKVGGRYGEQDFSIMAL